MSCWARVIRWRVTNRSGGLGGTPDELSEELAPIAPFEFIEKLLRYRFSSHSFLFQQSRSCGKILGHRAGLRPSQLYRAA